MSRAPKIVATLALALLALVMWPLATSAQPKGPAKPSKPAPSAAPSASAAPAAPAPSATPAAPAPSAQPSAPAPTGATPGATEGGDEDAPNPANRAEAEEHFNRGMKLYGDEAWQAALAEFLRSRELFKTRTATNNAAYCLRKLNRFDEALDMYESMLREYPNMAADKKQAAQKEVTELRALVGTIDITGGEPGASIVIDGQARADFPLIDPLRVGAGSHTVRLFKDGFQSYETSVDVAGGQTVKVEAKMPALTASGRLKVAEKSGKAMDVVVDGAVVGVTPWEGSLAVGDHVVLLRGDEDTGTPPTAAIIKRDDVTSLTLAADTLESAMVVEVRPSSGGIVIDSVPVGHGIWDGRLKAGPHTISFEQAGFFSQKKDVSLDRGEKKEMKVELERDENAAAWRKPSKIVFDLSGGFAVAPTFGGDVSSSCDSGCSPGLGGLVMLHGAYQFSNGFSLGLAGGFYQGSQSIDSRKTTLQPVGITPGDAGTSSEDLRLRGYLVGITGGWHFFERFPLQLRLGAGAMIANARNVRNGSFTTRAGSPYKAPELESDATAAFVYIDPEATIGVRIGDHVELGVGAQVLVLIAASKPTWGDGEPSKVVVEGDGLASYKSDETLVGNMVLVVPGLKARVDF